MALIIKQKNENFGIEIDNAYINITAINFTKTDTFNYFIELSIWASKTHKNMAVALPFNKKTLQISINNIEHEKINTNIIKWIYKYLKNLPDYRLAIDDI